MYWDYDEKKDTRKNMIFYAVSAGDFGTMFGGDPPYALRDLCSECEAELVVLCDSADVKKCLEDESWQEWLKESLLIKYLIDIVDVSGGERANVIQEYLDSHEHKEYVIIDHEELEPFFYGHTVYLSGTFDKQTSHVAERILLYPPFGSEMAQNTLRGKYGDLIEDYITKVIFLDVDGVLNDADKRRRNGEIICPEYVKNLAWIVEQTGADIILSSSWRYGMLGDRKDADIQILLDEFAKYHLRISGITPLFFNGPDGRPYEVRSWLTHRPDVESFVILDDENFWKWKWMSDRFVWTSREARDDEDFLWGFDNGLKMEYAQKAVEILNGEPAQ